MLSDIVTYKQLETREKASRLPLARVEQQAAQARPARNLRNALIDTEMTIIAEAKYRSPSKGILRAHFDPLALASSYQDAGAAAISILGDSRFFGGGPFVVAQVAQDSRIHVPVLFKDFICSPYQVFEARATGADAVLLIVRILTPSQLGELLDLSRNLGMTALVETFDADDIHIACDVGADVIGINNRDLNNFEVNFARTSELVRILGKDVLAVSESGISNQRDMLQMKELGFHAALIGEAILTADDPSKKIRQLRGVE